MSISLSHPVAWHCLLPCFLMAPFAHTTLWSQVRQPDQHCCWPDHHTLLQQHRRCEQFSAAYLIPHSRTHRHPARHQHLCWTVPVHWERDLFCVPHCPRGVWGTCRILRCSAAPQYSTAAVKMTARNQGSLSSLINQRFFPNPGLVVNAVGQLASGQQKSLIRVGMGWFLATVTEEQKRVSRKSNLGS